MGEPPPHLFRSWVHSFEEDTGDVAVYRPADHPFPPARGRRGLEIDADGTFVDRPVGRGDALEEIPGRWRLAEDRLDVSFPEADRPDRRLEILRCGPDILEVRSTPA